MLVLLQFLHKWCLWKNFVNPLSIVKVNDMGLRSDGVAFLWWNQQPAGSPDIERTSVSFIISSHLHDVNPFAQFQQMTLYPLPHSSRVICIIVKHHQFYHSHYSCSVTFRSLPASEFLQGPHHCRRDRCLSGLWSGTSLR